MCILSLDIIASLDFHTLPLHDALPIYSICAIEGRMKRSKWTTSPPDGDRIFAAQPDGRGSPTYSAWRSEEHTSELQSPCNIVCRLLLENINTLLCIDYIIKQLRYIYMT